MRGILQKCLKGFASLLETLGGAVAHQERDLEGDDLGGASPLAVDDEGEAERLMERVPEGFARVRCAFAFS